MADLIHAPFTEEQVRVLSLWQEGRGVHPYTCVCYIEDTTPAVPGTGDPEFLCRWPVVLTATTEGWVCPEGCGYTQDWAHAFSADEDAVRSLSGHWWAQ